MVHGYFPEAPEATNALPELTSGRAHDAVHVEQRLREALQPVPRLLLAADRREAGQPLRVLYRSTCLRWNNLVLK